MFDTSETTIPPFNYPFNDLSSSVDILSLLTENLSPYGVNDSLELPVLTASAVKSSKASPAIFRGAVSNDEITGLEDSQPTISINDKIVEEGDDGKNKIKLKVSLSEASDEKVIVKYRTFEETALEGEDFKAKKGKLVFKPGQTTKNIKVNIFGDTIQEEDEVFGIKLRKPKNATIGNKNGKITIVNDDSDNLVTTDSGLQYIDIKVGSGDNPTTGEEVIVHYTGTLEDGTKFDSSLDRGTPFSFVLGVGQVIAGWDEGIATMKLGGERQLIIPSELGYGSSGAGDDIPPNATLLFDVELLGIVDDRIQDTELLGFVKGISDDDFNAKDIVKTDSGVKYIDLESDSGDNISSGQEVIIDYTLNFENRSPFSITVFPETPITLNIGEGEFLEGWDEGLGNMKVGGKRQLAIPPELAFGSEFFDDIIEADDPILDLPLFSTIEVLEIL